MIKHLAYRHAYSKIVALGLQAGNQTLTLASMSHKHFKAALGSWLIEVLV